MPLPIYCYLSKEGQLVEWLPEQSVAEEEFILAYYFDLFSDYF